MDPCRAAVRWSIAAVVIAIMAMLYSTWYLPGLVMALNTLSERLDRMNWDNEHERNTGSDFKATQRG